MFRIKLILIAVGFFVAFGGVLEYRLSVGVSPEPVSANLAEIEQGSEAPDAHLLFGEHLALYAGCVYSYKQPKGAGNSVSPDAEVTETLYPIISLEHPWYKKLTELENKFGDLEKIPDEVFPEIDQFQVLVKTKAYKKINEIPDGVILEDSLKGLAINKIKKLDKDELGYLKQSFPNADLSKVLILEADRKPMALGTSIAMIIIGGIISLAVLFWMIPRKRASGRDKMADRGQSNAPLHNDEAYDEVEEVHEHETAAK